MAHKPVRHLPGVGTHANSQPSDTAGCKVADEEVEIAVGEVKYLLIPNHKVALTPIPCMCLLFTTPLLVLVYNTTPDQTISKSTLRDFHASVLHRDNVFRPEFFRNVLFYGAEKEALNFEPDAVDYLASWGTEFTYFVASGTEVEPGPYVVKGGRTWQPWKIYHHFNSTFMTTFKPLRDISSGLAVLDTPYAGTSGRVIVPSRCYYRPSKERPLDRARITIKDNIDTSGHRTRAWLELYPEKTKTAACIKILTDAGAIILGKVKLQAMIMREKPLECVEFTAPFNPRADGYQVPSGSSHASAAGVASYDWLDLSIGSDTNGRIRPSTGIMDTEGVVGQFPLFDMPVFFGRDLSRFSDFISVCYRLKFSILSTTYLPTPNAAQTSLIEKFVKGLELSLGVSRTKVSVAELWKRDLPDGPEHSDIVAYLYLAGAYPYYRDSHHDLASFRDEYQQKYGKPPFVQHAMRWQWDISKTISLGERDEYWRRSEIYRQWLLERVFDFDSKTSMTIMVFPTEVGKPNYREAELAPLAILPGSALLNMSPMMRAPELTAPVGDIPYHSWITQRQEHLPIAVSAIGAPGTDLILADLVSKGLKGAGLPTQVKTGSLVFGK